MGSATRGRQAERFIDQFGETHNEKIDSVKTWKHVENRLGLGRFDEEVVIYRVFRCVETGEEMELTIPCPIFEGEDSFLDVNEQLKDMMWLVEKGRMTVEELIHKLSIVYCVSEREFKPPTP